MDAKDLKHKLRQIFELASYSRSKQRATHTSAPPTK